MISKQKTKDFSLKQMSRANKFFWSKMALWIPKLAKFSEQKAIKLNVLKTAAPAPVKLDSSSKLSDEVMNVLNTLQTEVHQSHLLLEQLNAAAKPSKQVTIPVGSKGKSVNNFTVEFANELRVYLEKNEIFQEQSWLNLWLENPNYCEFAECLLTKYPPLESCETEIYDGIAARLATVSENKVELIIPKIDAEYDNKLHELVEHRPVKGRANHVLEIKRVGLCCDGKVLFKAQVVCS
jgi:hypothetical protein